MTLFKKHTVGCGVLLNPNGDSSRCGQKAHIFNQRTQTVLLCENCRVKQQANVLIDLVEKP